MSPERKEQLDMVRSDAFHKGYFAGMDDPGFSTSTQPETIQNPFPPGTKDHEYYEAGYRSAIA